MKTLSFEKDEIPSLAVKRNAKQHHMRVICDVFRSTKLYKRLFQQAALIFEKARHQNTCTDSTIKRLGFTPYTHSASREHCPDQDEQRLHDLKIGRASCRERV